jgi:hypothetical protein
MGRGEKILLGKGGRGLSKRYSTVANRDNLQNRALNSLHFPVTLLLATSDSRQNYLLDAVVYRVKMFQDENI